MLVDEKTTDEKLVVYIREINKEYYSFIIDRYEGKIRAYLNRLTNFSPEVDDLLQQTLVNAYVNLQGFDAHKKFSSWLYRIAHNLAINWLKKKKAHISIDENERVANSLASEIDIPREIANKELSGHITAAINKLPEKFKEPFILKYMEDKTYEEISEILRKPKNTIGTMISRAKKILRGHLKGLF